MEERNVGTIGRKSVKQDETIELSEGRESPYHKLDYLPPPNL